MSKSFQSKGSSPESVSLLGSKSSADTEFLIDSAHVLADIPPSFYSQYIY